MGDFDELASVVHTLMASFPAPWCVAGGWALDLFLGRVTRPHADLELAVFRQDQPLLRALLPRWSFEKVVDGRRAPWPPHEQLSLPVHEIYARSPEPARTVEFLLNERDAENWVFRRDPRVSLPLVQAIVHSSPGLPVLSPAVVLLFKAKLPRPKDEADFRAA